MSTIDLVDHCRRIFWICIMISLIFLILGTVYFMNLQADLFFTPSVLMFIYFIWLLNMFLLIIFTYYAILNNRHCIWLIFVLFIVTLVFSTFWAIQFTSNIAYANFSIVIVLIFSLAIIYLAPSIFQILGILYLLIWLFLFFYINKLIK